MMPTKPPSVASLKSMLKRATAMFHCTLAGSRLRVIGSSRTSLP